MDVKHLKMFALYYKLMMPGMVFSRFALAAGMDF
jgi:hypothetical protein